MFSIEIAAEDLCKPLAAAAPLPPGFKSRVDSPAQVRLPLAVAAAPRPRVLETRAGSRLVLVVDDEEQVREGLKCILEMDGYDVIAAEDLAEALEGISTWMAAPAAIIADYRLRDGQIGTDAIRGVRADVGRAVPAVVLTGEIKAAVQEDAKSIGVEVLHKPVDPMQLIAYLERMMSSPQLLAATA